MVVDCSCALKYKEGFPKLRRSLAHSHPKVRQSLDKRLREIQAPNEMAGDPRFSSGGSRSSFLRASLHLFFVR